MIRRLEQALAADPSDFVARAALVAAIKDETWDEKMARYDRHRAEHYAGPKPRTRPMTDIEEHLAETYNGTRVLICCRFVNSPEVKP